MFMSTDNLVLSQGCRGDLQGLATECAKYVQKQGYRVEPSRACCDVIKSVDVPCLCRHITKDVKDVLDMDKVAHVEVNFIAP
ncbi:hypothetical protein K2173_024906 [Erythroxylum novogranatense]|uniref:Bifunctional inhibitor/plant lipid transfer protein/seed storage helical domain-containing protein n=1 Tax=Erythroxylum novogranatense TaxID=1862640 RepID=A0AAV8UHY5_9ROSI|nr:hypothetical protein K2173_024906 [Erythroxylum novogranatense]